MGNWELHEQSHLITKHSLESGGTHASEHPICLLASMSVTPPALEIKRCPCLSCRASWKELVTSPARACIKNI